MHHLQIPPIGYAQIDDDHRHLLAQLEELQEALADAPSPEMLHRAVEELASYLLFHTFKEEKLMWDHHYPKADYERHLDAHKGYLGRLVALRERVRRSHELSRESLNALGEETLALFHSLAHDHIPTLDAALAEYLRRHPAGR